MSVRQVGSVGNQAGRADIFRELSLYTPNTWQQKDGQIETDGRREKKQKDEKIKELEKEKEENVRPRELGSR